jgi:hypothetical protein
MEAAARDNSDQQGSGASVITSAEAFEYGRGTLECRAAHRYDGKTVKIEGRAERGTLGPAPGPCRG